MSQRVPPKLVRIRPICKHSYSAALDRLFLGLLLPLSRPPFAGKSPLLAESLVHSSGGALILALGQGNRPSGGQHDSPADILSELEIHSGGGRLRARAPPSLRQPGTRRAHRALRQGQPAGDSQRWHAFAGEPRRLRPPQSPPRRAKLTSFSKQANRLILVRELT